MNKLILATPLFLFLFIGIASAAPTLPSGIQYYVPLNLSTSWNVGHGAYVQQMVNLSESNATWGSHIAYSSSTANFEYFYQNGTVIPSWIESNQSGKIITWAKIKNTTTFFYLGFASKTTNLLSSSGTQGIGEAPQLSSTYAQYDDGASVFSYYQRWGGLSALPSGWTATGVSATLNAQSTTIYATTNGTRGAIVSSFPISATPFILETYGLFYDSGLATNFEYGLFGSSTPNTDLDYTLVFAQATTGDVGVYNPAISSGVYNYAQATANSIQGIALASTTSIFTYQNYQLGYSNSALTASSFSYLQYGSESTTIPLNIYWTRVRAYPPNGVMPSVSFGAVQLSVSLSISPNPSTYGQSVTLTATCPIGDSCAIDYPSLGTAIATGTGSATYTYNAFAL